MKRALAIGLAAVLVVALAGLYYMRAGHAPAGQPALVEMNSRVLSGLQADFNRAPSSVRVVLLLSPT